MERKQVELQTPKGVVFLEGPADGAYLETLTMNSLLNNFRPADRQKTALVKITELPDGMIYLARHQREIVAYVAFHRPDEYSRWSRHPRVLEMGGIEVSPAWRQCRIAENLLKLAFSNERLEDFIVITTEYCWHWDLKNTGLSLWGYQQVLTRLFGQVGLKKVTTDDPDILEHPANVLMAKIGSRVSKEDIALFEKMRFLNKYTQTANLF
ncbi:MAG: GNAT family N-acetyltransferase [Desulfotomaculales bacterium]